MMSEDQFSLVCAIAKAAEGSSWEADQDQASPCTSLLAHFLELTFFFAFLSLTRLPPLTSLLALSLPISSNQLSREAFRFVVEGDYPLLVVVTIFQRSHAV